jgi:hypothetical protein
MGSGDRISSALDDTMADPHMAREVLTLLARMAYAGLKEYYGAWDDESCHWTISREHALAEDLSTIEAQLLQTHEGTTELMKAHLKVVETEVRQAYQDDMDKAGARPTRQLPPGTPVSYAMMRGLSILRQREREG